MQLYVLALILDVVAAPTCVTRGSDVACGYKCTSNLDKLQCAQTPEGLCASTPSMVTCWDPPPDVRLMLQSRRDDLPQPTCITSLGRAACGHVRAALRSPRVLGSAHALPDRLRPRHSLTNAVDVDVNDGPGRSRTRSRKRDRKTKRADEQAFIRRRYAIPGAASRPAAS